MIEIKNVSKQYENEFALHDITMTIGNGMNFIIGSSGSGKTTLLKILSGMEQDFDGVVLYCGQNSEELSSQEKSYFYNNIFGFVWQDFNLLDELTVLENVMLPQYLKQKQDEKAAMKILRELKISELANQKAGKLSGGQKQRVAIARELMKNPQVIFADEPTSALDEKSSKIMMDILRDISKKRTVIVITHDTSLIDKRSKVYELDKGELIAVPDSLPGKMFPPDQTKTHRLSFPNALRLAFKNAKSKTGRFAAATISLLAASILMLAAVSGIISDSSNSAFDDLFAAYGQNILDISVAGSFISAGATDGQQKEEPTANVTQDIDGLYEQYLHDERVSHIVFEQAYNNIQITVDGKDYKLETSNSVPTVNELTAGIMPMGNGNEVVVPQTFVKKLGLSDQDALGKTIVFTGTIYNWNSGKPVAMPVSTVATIVGVADTTVKYNAGAQIMEYSIDDAFFFSKTALEEMRAQADMKDQVSNFSIRTKTPADLISVKDELNAKGIVPLGRFELVEDMVRLNNQTNKQSGSAVIVIGILSAAAALAISLMTALTRKREYAIYKVCGYSVKQLELLTFAEFLLAAAATTILFFTTSPLTNLAAKALGNRNLLNPETLFTGVVIVCGMSLFSCIITILAARGTPITTALKTGDR